MVLLISVFDLFNKGKYSIQVSVYVSNTLADFDVYWIEISENVGSNQIRRIMLLAQDFGTLMRLVDSSVDPKVLMMRSPINKKEWYIRVRTSSKGRWFIQGETPDDDDGGEQIVLPPEAMKRLRDFTHNVLRICKKQIKFVWNDNECIAIECIDRDCFTEYVSPRKIK